MEDGKNEMELIRKISLGDKSALLELYRRYEYLLFNYAKSYVKSDKDAEEIVQDVIYKIWDKAHTFNFDSFAKVRGWILTICRNIAIDRVRKDKKSIQSIDEKSNMNLIPDINISIEDYVERKIIFDQIKMIISTLPSDQREIIELIYFNGLTQSEVAQIKSISVNTVKGKIRLALNKLRNRLKLNYQAGDQNGKQR